MNGLFWQSRLKRLCLPATKQIVTAFVVALLFTAATLVEPVDQLIYTMQARISSKAPSGDIVFVALDPVSRQSNKAERYVDLSNLLDRIHTASPELVLVDQVFDRTGSKQANDSLRASLQSFGNRLWLVDRMVEDIPGNIVLKSTAADIGAGVNAAPNMRVISWMHFSWTMPTHISLPERSDALSAPAVLAGVRLPSKTDFRIDYRYPVKSFTAFEAAKVMSDDSVLRKLRGKRIIIGSPADGSTANTASAPGNLELPSSFIIILAAETLRQGAPLQISPYVPLIIFFLASLATNLIVPRRHYYLAYGTQVAGFFAALALPVFNDAVVGLSSAIVFGVIRVLQVAWQKFKARASQFDQSTGLPTFRALEAIKQNNRESLMAVVVGKIHNFDDAILELPDTKHATCIGKIVDRFQVIDRKMQVYGSGFQYFAFLLPLASHERVRHHLEGVRELFRQPISIDGVELDLGLTFGVSTTSDAVMRERLTSARKAADEANEADLPIVFARVTDADERIWNLTLQHQIDRALRQGEIYPVFQPQIATTSSQMIGVEALVRWRDPQRGMIPPTAFIEHCEQAGRMDALTKYMLEEGMRQVGSVPGPALRLSVNISATTLQDDRLIAMVRDALAVTGFDATMLTLELTETWRILDQSNARSVMDRIKRQGVRWALDDFGIKTSTFETLLAYEFDELKIDRLFTSNILSGSLGRATVRALCSIGAEASLDIVAEGVETKAEFLSLNALGCPIVQGYYFSKPLDAAGLSAFAAAQVTANSRATA